MLIRIGRTAVIAITIEVLAILVLVLIVALFGPADPEGAQAYAERLGYWVGPIAGFVLCIAGGWLVARNLAKHQILYGLVLGVTVAVIDIAILVAGGVEFQPIFAASNIGKIVAGTIGGWVASRSGENGTEGSGIEENSIEKNSMERVL